MRMESAAILILRKVLNPDFPLHQAIIDRSQAPDEHEGSSDQNIPLVAVGNGATSRVGIKRERTTSSPVNSNRAVKREPNGAPRRSSIEDDECIDLT